MTDTNTSDVTMKCSDSKREYKSSTDVKSKVDRDRMEYFWANAVRYKTVRRLLTFAQSHFVGWMTRRELAECIDMDPRQVRTHMETLLLMGVYEERTSDGKAQYQPNDSSLVLDNLMEIECVIERNIGMDDHDYG